jgi:hypothetical protein
MSRAWARALDRGNERSRSIHWAPFSPLEAGTFCFADAAFLGD